MLMSAFQDKFELANVVEGYLLLSNLNAFRTDI